jgi:hypothetical protein
MDLTKLEFEDFAEKMGKEMNSKKHSWVIFLCFLLFISIWFFLVLPLSGLMLIFSGLLLWPILIWLFNLNENLDMKIIDSNQCPICHGKLSIFRNEEQFWIIKCPSCMCEASTKYQGFHSGD